MNNNSGLSSHRLCQLLTQNTTPDPLHSPASMDGRRVAVSRNQQGSGNPVSSSNCNLMSSSVGMANLGMDLNQASSSNIVMRSPDDHLHQSPTEGPGQSPPQKPQSTSNEDGEAEVTNGVSSHSNSGGRVTGGIGGASSNNSNNNISGGGGGGNIGDRNNYILKTLLSQDDDDEPSMLDASMSSIPLSSMGHTASSSDNFNNLVEKNEAEPRKANALLKVMFVLHNYMVYLFYGYFSKCFL